MSAAASPTVLLLGGTGRTGRLALAQLLESGAYVRAVVRSAERLPEEWRDHHALVVVEADLLSLSEEYLRGLAQGCDAVVSCLGHKVSLAGVFGRPRALVTRSVMRVCRAAEALRPARPVKVVLMSSVSVNQPTTSDARRGWVEKAVLVLLRGLVPPARDNQRAADYLRLGVGTANPYLEWVVVRPDTLLEGGSTGYAVHEGLVSSLARPDSTNRANVARFMRDLICDLGLWHTWRLQFPVIINEQ